MEEVNREEGRGRQVSPEAGREGDRGGPRLLEIVSMDGPGRPLDWLFALLVRWSAIICFLAACRGRTGTAASSSPLPPRHRTPGATLFAS
jgi:hypothetical protein